MRRERAAASGVVLHDYEQMLTVPSAAIGTHKDERGRETKFVMRVDPNDTCYEQEVTVVMEKDGHVAIESDEVSTNDRVVVKDLDRVKHKQSLAERIKTLSRYDSE